MSSKVDNENLSSELTKNKEKEELPNSSTKKVIDENKEDSSINENLSKNFIEGGDDKNKKTCENNLVLEISEVSPNVESQEAENFNINATKDDSISSSKKEDIINNDCESKEIASFTRSGRRVKVPEIFRRTISSIKTSKLKNSNKKSSKSDYQENNIETKANFPNKLLSPSHTKDDDIQNSKEEEEELRLIEENLKCLGEGKSDDFENNEIVSSSTDKFSNSFNKNEEENEDFLFSKEFNLDLENIISSSSIKTQTTTETASLLENDENLNNQNNNLKKTLGEEEEKRSIRTEKRLKTISTSKENKSGDETDKISIQFSIKYDHTIAKNDKSRNSSQVEHKNNNVKEKQQKKEKIQNKKITKQKIKISKNKNKKQEIENNDKIESEEELINNSKKIQNINDKNFKMEKIRNQKSKVSTVQNDEENDTKVEKESNKSQTTETINIENSIDISVVGEKSHKEKNEKEKKKRGRKPKQNNQDNKDNDSIVEKTESMDTTNINTINSILQVPEKESSVINDSENTTNLECNEKISPEKRKRDRKPKLKLELSKRIRIEDQSEKNELGTTTQMSDNIATSADIVIENVSNNSLSKTQKSKIGKKKPELTDDRKINPKLLLVTNRADIFNDSFPPPLSTDDNRKLEKNEIKCGLCKIITTDKKWLKHLSEHYGIGWKDGIEKPVVRFI